MNSKNKIIRDLYRGINYFKWGYQPRSNYFPQLLNVHRVSDVRQIEIHTAEHLVPDSSLSELEIAIVNLKRFKLPDCEQIPAEFIQAGGELLRSKIHNLINSSIWNKGELPDQFT
jgi:hypothetical protein